MLRRAVRPGFSGAPASRTGSHPRRPCSHSLAESPSQALKNALRSVFHPRHLRTPRTATRARGKPQKPYSRRERSTGSRTGNCFCESHYGVAVAGGFQGISPAAAGCGDGEAVDADEVAALRACEEMWTWRCRRRSRVTFRGCEPGRVTDAKASLAEQHPENRRRTPKAAVDPRKKNVVIRGFFALLIR